MRSWSRFDSLTLLKNCSDRNAVRQNGKMSSNGLVAIVTGAAQGIGYEITDILLQEGYKVCLVDVNGTKGKETASEFEKKYGSSQIIFVECNITNKANFEDVFSRTQKKFGRIDLVVNNAGIIDEHDPERCVAVNLMGPIIGCQLALKFMGKSYGGRGGTVVNVASIAGLVPFEGAPVYDATKHGVVGLTRSYGSQPHLDKNGVTFMAICPFVVKTPMIENSGSKLLIPFDETMFSAAIEPKFVAEGVRKLLTDRKNGSTLTVFPGKLEYSEIQEELKNILQS